MCDVLLPKIVIFGVCQIAPMNNFTWNTHGDTTMPPLDTEILERWLVDVARSHGKIVGDINYIFCDDEHILSVNREFLDHDYYTDIITFDRTMRNLLRGDVVISLDTVRSNAENLGQPYSRELARVVVHGLLHLAGIDDKGPGEREIMERHEDDALEMLADKEYFHEEGI